MKVSSNWMSDMPESVYIHIPFCKSKCKYCSFVSFGQYNIEYFSHLEKEIDTYYKGESLKTLYFGGGTPSIMEIETAQRLINKFNLQSGAENKIKQIIQKTDNLEYKALDVFIINQMKDLH